MKTSEKSLNAEDVRECCDEDPNLSGLKESSVGKSIAVILTEASVHQGVLEIKVSDQSMDCCFTQQDWICSVEGFEQLKIAPRFVLITLRFLYLISMIGL